MIILDFRGLYTFNLPDFKIVVGDPPHLVHYHPGVLIRFQNFDGYPPHLVHYTPGVLTHFKMKRHHHPGAMG